MDANLNRRNLAGFIPVASHFTDGANGIGRDNGVMKTAL